MLKPFKQLGDKVAREWAKAGNSDEAFVDIAVDHLAKSEVLTEVEPQEIVSWLMTSKDVPEQGDKDFGQPPMIVYAGDDFFIQAIFWVDGTTSIHEHGFVGAFGVLHGSSVESTYTFSTQKVMSNRFSIGQTHFVSSELLKRGDVRPIYPADKLIHSLFHLDRPSVSVVVRTPIRKEPRPQYYYAKPHLALHDIGLPQVVPIQLQMLQSLWIIDKISFWDAAAKLSLNCDPYVLYQVLSMAFRVAPTSQEKWSELLALAGERDKWFLDHVLLCLEEAQRTEKLVALRSSTHDPVHRFFLALLLNVPSRAEMYKLIQQRFPDEQPSILVVRWLGEIFKQKQAGIQLTPSWLWLINCILEDPEFEHSRAELLKKFQCKQEADEEKLRKAWIYLCSVDLFKPLMNTVSAR